MNVFRLNIYERDFLERVVESIKKEILLREKDAAEKRAKSDI